MTTKWNSGLTLTHTDRSKIHEAIEAYKNGRLLSYLCPGPETNEKEVRSEDWARDLIEGLLQEATEESCEARDCSCGSSVEVEFKVHTVGVPPIAAFRSAHTRHGFSVKAIYVEADDRFVGYYHYNKEGEGDQR